MEVEETKRQGGLNLAVSPRQLCFLFIVIPLAPLARGFFFACAHVSARSYNVDRSTISRLKPKPETAAA